MNPWNRPSSRLDHEEPVSPGTRPQNYNALLRNNIAAFSTTESWTSRRSSAAAYAPTHSHQSGVPVPKLDRIRNLQYTGHVLGKRGNQRYNLNPRSRKRRCLTSEFEVFNPSLTQPGSFRVLSSMWPEPDKGTAFVDTYHADPYLSRLPLTVHQFADMIRHPEPAQDWVASAALGNDVPAGSNARILQPEGIHPLFRQLLLPRAGDASSSWWNVHMYPGMWRALQLATRFLSNKHTLAFFYKILFQEPIVLEPKSQLYDGVPILHLASTPTDTHGLTQEQRTLTTDALASLSSHIAIHFAVAGADSRATSSTTTWASTERIPGSNPTSTLAARIRRHKILTTDRLLPPLGPPAFITPSSPSPADVANPASCQTRDQYNPPTAHVRSLNFRGTNARISLSTVFLRYLARPISPGTTIAAGATATTGSNEPSLHARQYALFFLAVTLVREVAHAAWMCCAAPPPPPSRPQHLIHHHSAHVGQQQQQGEGVQEHEPFTDDSLRRADLGAAWEASVFGGGCVEVLAAHGHGADQLFEFGLGLRHSWPDCSEELVLLPGSEGENQRQPSPSSSMTMLAQSDGRREEEVRVLPFRFVAVWFRDEFWRWADDAAGEEFRQWMKAQVDGWVGAAVVVGENENEKEKEDAGMDETW